MRYSLLLLLFIVSNVMAESEIIQSAVIGCPLASQTQYLEMDGLVDIQKSYLDKFKDDKVKQEEIKKTALETQLKYLVGSFKEFKSDEIAKATFSHYQKDLKIKEIEHTFSDYPETDSFWPKSRVGAFNEYVQHVMKEGPGKKAVVRIHYSILVHTFICAKKNQSPEKFTSLLNEVPFPRDPFVGIWINTKEERHKEGGDIIRPDCFNHDFLVFGVPEEAWFFWSPIQLAKKDQCKIKNQSMVFKKAFRPVNIKKKERILGEKITSSLTGTLYFGAINEDEKYFSRRSMDDYALKITEVFKYCEKEKRPRCMGKWNDLFKVGDKYIEPGAGNFIYFLKYLTTLVSVDSYSIKEKGSNYIILELMIRSPKSNRVAKTRVYYGPTSLYNPLLAPKRYWESMYKSMHEDDFISYIGHAGVGQNLMLQTMEKNSGIKEAKIKRTKPLYFGIFNCEGLSYFGFDYEKIFKEKGPANLIYLISSSGVEVNSLFSLSYLDFLLNHDTFKDPEFKFAINDYVQSRDFLGFQKIYYTKE